MHLDIPDIEVRYLCKKKPGQALEPWQGFVIMSGRLVNRPGASFVNIGGNEIPAFAGMTRNTILKIITKEHLVYNLQWADSSIELRGRLASSFGIRSYHTLHNHHTFHHEERG